MWMALNRAADTQMPTWMFPVARTKMGCNVPRNSHSSQTAGNTATENSTAHTSEVPEKARRALVSTMAWASRPPAH